MNHLPNLLSALRIVAVPVLLALAWNGERGAFFVVFGLGLLTDVLDGPLARRLGVATGLGARLDQWGDFALWGCLPFAAWWLWPDVVVREAVYIAIAVACMILPTLVAWVRYREVPGYHTWSVKLGSVAMGVALPLLLLFDWAIPFRLAALFQVVCALDELGITALSKECRHDVPSFFHALRDVRS